MEDTGLGGHVLSAWCRPGTCVVHNCIYFTMKLSYLICNVLCKTLGFHQSKLDIRQGLRTSQIVSDLFRDKKFVA